MSHVHRCTAKQSSNARFLHYLSIYLHVSYISLSVSVSFSSILSRELEAELLKNESLLNTMHEEMQKSQQPIASTYGTTTPTNIDKDKEEQLWAQQRLVTALKRKVRV
jgi:hypothetical protein